MLRLVETLDYERNPAGSDQAPAAAERWLLAIPFTAGAAALISTARRAAKPFGTWRAEDFAVFAGALAVAAVALGAWVVLARGRRLRWHVVLPVAGWLAMCALAAAANLIRYFGEPWNT